jgi:hypothetical protein
MAEQHEIVEPLDLVDESGEVIDRADPDALIAAYERTQAEKKRLDSILWAIRLSICDLASKDDQRKTLRVAGRERIAVLTQPDDSWDQARLKECWNSYPDLAPRYMRIKEIGVQLVEFKKLLSTYGTQDVETFKAMLQAANRGRLGLASIKIER